MFYLKGVGIFSNLQSRTYVLSCSCIMDWARMKHFSPYTLLWRTCCQPFLKPLSVCCYYLEKFNPLTLTLSHQVKMRHSAWEWSPISPVTGLGGCNKCNFHTFLPPPECGVWSIMRTQFWICILGLRMEGQATQYDPFFWASDAGFSSMGPLFT